MPSSPPTSAMMSLTLTVLLIVKTVRSVSLDEAILADLIPSTTIDESGSSCADPGEASSSTFTFPGTVPDTWNSNFEQYESDLFLAQLQHVDPVDADRSWTMRIGKSGAMYSFESPNTYGEAMPPQNRQDSPWIDEVSLYCSGIYYSCIHIFMISPPLMNRCQQISYSAQ